MAQVSTCWIGSRRLQCSRPPLAWFVRGVRHSRHDSYWRAKLARWPKTVARLIEIDVVKTHTFASILFSLVIAAFPVASRSATEFSARDSLIAQYGKLRTSLDDSPFHRPIVLNSMQSSTELKGDVYALLSDPFSNLTNGLAQQGEWCEVLILHLNIKYCKPMKGSSGSRLQVYVGRKFDVPLQDAAVVEFDYQVISNSADYFQAVLKADAGPFETKNYRMMLEATPLDGRIFAHLSYSYAYGVVAKLAAAAYLGTLGRDKLGFSVVGRQSNGQPTYVGGIRGAIERNVMRYHLAIEAYLSGPPGSSTQQREARLQRWFAATERYAIQLHELDELTYLEMKRHEYRRQDLASKQ